MISCTHSLVFVLQVPQSALHIICIANVVLSDGHVAARTLHNYPSFPEHPSDSIFAIIRNQLAKLVGPRDARRRSHHEPIYAAETIIDRGG